MTRLRKIAKFSFFLFLGFLIFKKDSLAQENSFITIVNPVRGEEFWGLKQHDPLYGAKLQRETLEKYNLSATWLLRFDAISSATISSYFKDFFKNHELGVFLEITPKLAEMAQISYPSGGIFWHDANKIFLSGHKPEDREKIVDAVFTLFRNTFGFYPKSVGAWHIDAYSAEYMSKKYGVTGVLICADQFSTDGYQIWGGWWGVPYYPSKYNILIPAQTLKNKLDLVVFWWAARDPELGYGGSVGESIYSVQVNDYQKHGLGTEYFQKLLDLYLKNNNKFSQLTVGLENDNDWEKIGEGFELQAKEIKSRQDEKELRVVTIGEFADWYRKNFKISPVHNIGGWILSPEFRIGFVEKDGKKFIRDLRIYNENWPEANLLTANPWETLSLNNPYKIDTVRFPDQLKELSFEISLSNLIKKFGSQKLPFWVNNIYFFLFFSFTLLLLVFLLRKNLPLLFLTIFGAISLSLPMIKSGLVYPFGMGFWGPNGHDGIWHIALINQLAKLNFSNPVFSGAKLINYHFGFDLVLAILHRLTRIPVQNLYFQVIPPILAVLIGILTYWFVAKWTKSSVSAWWATFFVYFGGSFGWVIHKGESAFWANQAVSTLINPPYALSLVFLLLGLNIFLDFLKKPLSKRLLILSLIFGFLIQIKVYAGVIVLFGLFLTALYASFAGRSQSAQIWKLAFLTTVIAAVVFFPFNFNSKSLLVFSPFWFPHTMLAFQDRFFWPRLENARQAYLATHQWFKWLAAELAALAIFVVGNLETRVLGLILVGSWVKKIRRLSEIEVLVLSLLGVSLIIPLVFIQKGNPWNTIQFFYYFQFFMGILAGVVIGKLNLGKVRILVLVFLVIMTLPTTIITLKNDYLPSRSPARVSVEELEALEFLGKQPNGVVLTFPYNEEWRYKFSEPKPLYAYETTAYVSGLGNKPVFLEDEMNLEISGYQWRERKQESLRFFQTDNKEWANTLLKTHKVKYIYLVKGQKMNLGEQDINAQRIFENGEIRIFEIKW